MANIIYGIVICVYLTVIGIRIYKIYTEHRELMKAYMEKGIEVRNRKFIDVLYEAIGFNFNGWGK